MEIKVLASGSSGNCYYVSDGKTGVLLDCGIPTKKIKESLWKLGKNLSDITAVLVTHEHKDHVYAAQKLLDKGLCVIASQGTIEAAGLYGHCVVPIPDRPATGGKVMIGTLSIYAYTVIHDAKEPMSFLVESEETKERLLYITDTRYFRYSMPKLNYILIEANYDPDILLDNAEKGTIGERQANRTIRNHMSIDTAVLTLERMDKSELKEVYLIHISKRNGGEDFKRRAQEICGCEVYACI